MKPLQYHLPLPLREAMGLEDFLLAAPNKEAARLLLQNDPSAWPSPALVLWGPEGAGKTHLLSIWAASFDATKVRIGDHEALGCLAEGSSTDAIFALDAADFVAGEEEMEEWLQHFYNAVAAVKGRVLITSRNPPASWGLKLRDIETRLKSCASLQLREPDDELMRGLLIKLFKDRQLLVEAGVVDYLAARLERTGTAIKKAVNKLDESALETGRKISIPFVQRILGFRP